MNLTIKNLTEEQYNNILDYAKTQTKEQYILTIFYDTFVDYETEIECCFDNREEIEDIKILNNLKDYTLCKKYEVKNEEYFNKEELQKDGYHLFYIEAYIHSGIRLYEFNGALKDRWDSGIAGIVAIKGDFKIAYKSFKEFLRVWQKCNDGEFYGYRIENQFGEDIDCCGGFFEIEDLKESLPDYITEQQYKNALNNIQY